MLSEEIKAIRRTGIAASDAAPIVHLSPWASPADVWVQKKYPEKCPEKKSKGIDWGNRLEDIIAQAYQEQTGQEVEKSPMLFNKNVPWMMCNPDRKLKKKEKGLECKTAHGLHAWEWGPAGTDRVPVHYLIQTTHCMMVTGYDAWDLAVLIGGSDFRIYHLYRNQELMRGLYAEEEEFYTRFIAGKEKPDFDWGKGLATYVEKMYPMSKPRVKGQPDFTLDVDTNGDDVLKQALKELLQAREQQDRGEEQEEINKTIIKAYMKDHDSLRFEELSKLLITWRNIKQSVKVDWLAVFEELSPYVDLTGEQKKMIVDKHTETKPGIRRFTVYDKRDKKKQDDDSGDAA